jgi:hypothetical protein
MAGEDLSRMDEVAGENLYSMLNFLQYKIQKSQLQNYLDKKNNK